MASWWKTVWLPTTWASRRDLNTIWAHFRKSEENFSLRNALKIVGLSYLLWSSWSSLLWFTGPFLEIIWCPAQISFQNQGLILVCEACVSKRWLLPSVLCWWGCTWKAVSSLRLLSTSGMLANWSEDHQNGWEAEALYGQERLKLV